MQTRESCLQADSLDPLARLKPLFSLPPGVIYLDGNSLRAMPRTAHARSTQVIEQEWGVA